MPQIFPRSANVLAPLTIIGGALAAGLLGTVGVAVYRSPSVTEVQVAKEQPIPFSHLRHVGNNGLDCRYCHTAVEESNSAGIPPIETCMTCHSQILGDQPMFDPLYAAWDMGENLEWLRIHDVPDFVYFNHSIHVAKGVACETCHGRVDQMPLTWKENTLHMQWCLECHRAPEKFIREPSTVFEMGYTPGPNDRTGEELVEALGIRKEQLINCSVCHR